MEKTMLSKWPRCPIQSSLTVCSDLFAIFLTAICGACFVKSRSNWSNSTHIYLNSAGQGLASWVLIFTQYDQYCWKCILNQGLIQDFQKGGSTIYNGVGVPFADFISFFLNIPWKWNNLVSLRPNFIFVGYYKTGGKEGFPNPLWIRHCYWVLIIFKSNRMEL